MFGPLMTTQELLAKLAETLSVEPERLSSNSRAGDIEEWDSMGTMSILLMLAREFKITVDANEADALQSVAGIIDVLRKHGLLQ